MAILITGGAGYIGSVTVEVLREAGETVVVIDDLRRGHRAALHADVPFFQGSLGDRELVGRIAREHEVEECIHFGALAYVGESVEQPRLYFENNVGEGLALLGSLLDAGLRRFVFSSTCATYGEPERVPIDEQHPQRPQNPYGWSKLMLERALVEYQRAHGLGFAALRYFNAAGATERLGEDHDPESHLIPLVLDTALGRRERVLIFGDDYHTDDGTAVRDYVHVLDLADAHLSALAHLRRGGSSTAVNLGSGSGHSVKQVIDVARRVTGREIPCSVTGRRAGDPARLVADAALARELLDWSPRRHLEEIIASAWSWKQRHPTGYDD